MHIYLQEGGQVLDVAALQVRRQCILSVILAVHDQLCVGLGCHMQACASAFNKFLRNIIYVHKISMRINALSVCARSVSRGRHMPHAPLYKDRQ